MTARYKKAVTHGGVEDRFGSVSRLRRLPPAWVVSVKLCKKVIVAEVM